MFNRYYYRRSGEKYPKSKHNANLNPLVSWIKGRRKAHLSFSTIIKNAYDHHRDISSLMKELFLKFLIHD